MPIPLSPTTEQLLDALFDEPFRSEVASVLVASVSENVPFCDDADAVGMERIRFSVLKLIAADARELRGAVELAQTDWRDLFMVAGFGYDPQEHKAWCAAVLDGPGSVGD